MSYTCVPFIWYYLCKRIPLYLLRIRRLGEKMSEDMGLIHVYTGDGKGKTTASLGLAVRARSRGM